MRIDASSSSIPPLHIAKAYGIKPSATAPTPAIAPLARPDAYEPSASVRNLVAGTVAQPANFDAPRSNSTAASLPAQVLQMYTRAADKIEAAVAVQLGRAIDLKG